MKKNYAQVPTSLSGPAGDEGGASQLVKIAVLDNEVQAQALGAALSELGIPHVLKSYLDSAYVGLFQMGQGWGHVEAPEERRAEVLLALADLSSPLPDESLSPDSMYLE